MERAKGVAHAELQERVHCGALLAAAASALHVLRRTREVDRTMGNVQVSEDDERLRVARRSLECGDVGEEGGVPLQAEGGARRRVPAVRTIHEIGRAHV